MNSPSALRLNEVAAGRERLSTGGPYSEGENVMTKAVSQSPIEEQRKEKREMRLNRFAIVTATALLWILGGVVPCAQGQDKGKYSLISPDGVAFSDFKG